MARSPILVLLLALTVSGLACLPANDTGPSSASPPSVDRSTGTAEGGAPQPFIPPVVASVSDGFRPPPGPFAAGNRGIEYETAPGTAVGAIGPGRVVFAGPVGGSRHVTVLHREGLRSSYSHLASISVAVGEAVLSGQALGTATHRLHLGVRAGDAYLDPALLFARGRVHLVPVDSDPAGDR